MFDCRLLDGAFQIVSRVISDKLLLDGITQDRSDVLFNLCCYFRIARSLHFFNGDKQITRIKLSNGFIANIREEGGFKAGQDSVLVIFRPFLFGSKPRFGNSFVRTSVVAFCF